MLESKPSNPEPTLLAATPSNTLNTQLTVHNSNFPHRFNSVADLIPTSHLPTIPQTTFITPKPTSNSSLYHRHPLPSLLLPHPHRPSAKLKNTKTLVFISET